jgi:hypothetical protein
LYQLEVLGNVTTQIDVLPALEEGKYFIAVAAVDHAGTVYALVSTVGDQAELRVRVRNSGWFKIGDASGLRALTACDGYLISASNDGRLLTRLAGELSDDEVLAQNEDLCRPLHCLLGPNSLGRVLAQHDVDPKVCCLASRCGAGPDSPVRPRKSSRNGKARLNRTHSASEKSVANHGAETCSGIEERLPFQI